MKESREMMTRENELGRLIFCTRDLTSARRLQRYLSRHPDLWLKLSPAWREAVENVILEAFLAECLVSGPAAFSFG